MALDVQNNKAYANNLICDAFEIFYKVPSRKDAVLSPSRQVGNSEPIRRVLAAINAIKSKHPALPVTPETSVPEPKGPSPWAKHRVSDRSLRKLHERKRCEAEALPRGEKYNSDDEDLFVDSEDERENNYIGIVTPRFDGHG